MNRFTLLQVVLTGMGATLVMDLWSLFQKYMLKTAPLNYALLGRWILWVPKGKLWHKTIFNAAPLRGECLTGWVSHYMTGIVFAFIPLMLSGPRWSEKPSLMMSIFTGLLTLLFPFLLLQPALGFGFAASRAPRPWPARLFSLLTHVAYGVGLYLTGLLIRL